MISKISKGLAEQYIRHVELIVKKTPGISIAQANLWRETGMIETDWRLARFSNLILAAASAAMPPSSASDTGH